MNIYKCGYEIGNTSYVICGFVFRSKYKVSIIVFKNVYELAYNQGFCENGES